MDAGLALIAFTAIPFLIVATVIFRRISSRAYTDAREKVVGGQRRPAGERRRAAGVAGAGPASSRTPRVSRPGATPTGGPGCGPRRRSRCTSRSWRCCPSSPPPWCSGSGRNRLVAGTVSAGTLLAFVLYLDYFFTPIQQLSQVFDGYQQADRRAAPDRRAARHPDLDAAGRAPAAGRPAGRRHPHRPGRIPLRRGGRRGRAGTGRRRPAHPARHARSPLSVPPAPASRPW